MPSIYLSLPGQTEFTSVVGRVPVGPVAGGDGHAGGRPSWAGRSSTERCRLWDPHAVTDRSSQADQDERTWASTAHPLPSIHVFPDHIAPSANKNLRVKARARNGDPGNHCCQQGNKRWVSFGEPAVGKRREIAPYPMTRAFSASCAKFRTPVVARLLIERACGGDDDDYDDYDGNASARCARVSLLLLLMLMLHNPPPASL